MEGDLIQIYDLARDREYVERVQIATVQGGEYALTREHGLFGSGSWWDAVRDGRIPATDLEGTIRRVYVNASNWPEFEVESGGETSTWALEGDAGRYRPGKRTCIRWVSQRYASPAPGAEAATRIVIAIWVED